MQTDETRARDVLALRAGYEMSRHDVDQGCSVLAKDAIRAMLAFAAPPAGEREDRVEAIALDVAETITAHMRSPDMIWGLGRIDPELLGEMEAELRSITVAALTNALSALSSTLHPPDREATARAAYDIVLVSQDRINPDGYQLHGLFYSFADAACHVAKDAALTAEQEAALIQGWSGSSNRYESAEVGAWWVAARQPIRPRS